MTFIENAATASSLVPQINAAYRAVTEAGLDKTALEKAIALGKLLQSARLADPISDNPYKHASNRCQKYADPVIGEPFLHGSSRPSTDDQRPLGAVRQVNQPIPGPSPAPARARWVQLPYACHLRACSASSTVPKVPRD
jgi:hypothetical protein